MVIGRAQFLMISLCFAFVSFFGWDGHTVQVDTELIDKVLEMITNFNAANEKAESKQVKQVANITSHHVLKGMMESIDESNQQWYRLL